MKVGIIGPTDLEKLTSLMGGSQISFLAKAARVGQIIAEKECCELWVNPDGGMLAAVAQAYKAHGGKKLVVLCPMSSEPWPLEHALPYTEIADEVRRVPDWFYTNYAVVSQTDLTVCVGLSAGVFSELAYLKWDVQFGKNRALVVIQELVRGGAIPDEIEENLRPILLYIGSVEDLSQALDIYMPEDCS